MKIIHPYSGAVCECTTALGCIICFDPTFCVIALGLFGGLEEFIRCTLANIGRRFAGGGVCAPVVTDWIHLAADAAWLPRYCSSRYLHHCCYWHCLALLLLLLLPAAGTAVNCCCLCCLGHLPSSTALAAVAVWRVYTVTKRRDRMQMATWCNWTAGIILYYRD